MRILFALLLLGFGLSSCGGDTAAAEKAEMEATFAAQENAYDMMMKAHDRVMPLMGQLTAAQKSVVAELESGADLPEGRKDLLEATNEQLEDAYDGMMDWMGGLKPLDELRASMDNDGIIAYIKDEGASIAKVEAATAAALGAAKELFGEHSHDGHDHDHDHSGHDH